MIFMKTTQKNIHSFVKSKLATDKNWALKALVRIYTENQTPYEQSFMVTTKDNGIGFTGLDAKFLSSLAYQYQQRGSLSDKQLSYVFKKIPKYHNQVIRMSDRTKLLELVKLA
jgi:hypothetical protein